jgi:hypothetical protein
LRDCGRAQNAYRNALNGLEHTKHSRFGPAGGPTSGYLSSGLYFPQRTFTTTTFAMLRTSLRTSSTRS